MEVEIFDSRGVKLQVGDMLCMQDKWHGQEGLTFFAKLEIDKDGSLFPFNKFAFERITKVDIIPSDAKHCVGNKDTREYWISPLFELFLVNENELEKWKTNRLGMRLLHENGFLKFVK